MATQTCTVLCYIYSFDWYRWWCFNWQSPLRKARALRRNALHAVSGSLTPPLQAVGYDGHHHGGQVYKLEAQPAAAITRSLGLHSQVSQHHMPPSPPGAHAMARRDCPPIYVAKLTISEGHDAPAADAKLVSHPLAAAANTACSHASGTGSSSGPLCQHHVVPSDSPSVFQRPEVQSADAAPLDPSLRPRGQHPPSSTRYPRNTISQRPLVTAVSTASTYLSTTAASLSSKLAQRLRMAVLKSPLRALDNTLPLRVQLLMVLLTAVFVLYPTWWVVQQE